jgi:hypothetical protein
MTHAGDTALLLALGVIVARFAGLMPRGDDRPPRTRAATPGAGARSPSWWLPALTGAAALVSGLGASDAVVLAAAMAVVTLLDSAGEP